MERSVALGGAPGAHSSGVGTVGQATMAPPNRGISPPRGVVPLLAEGGPMLLAELRRIQASPQVVPSRWRATVKVFGQGGWVTPHRATELIDEDDEEAWDDLLACSES